MVSVSGANYQVIIQLLKRDAASAVSVALDVSAALDSQGLSSELVDYVAGFNLVDFGIDDLIENLIEDVLEDWGNDQGTVSD